MENAEDLLRCGQTSLETRAECETQEDEDVSDPFISSLEMKKTNKCIKISQYKSKLFCSSWKEKIYEMQQNIKWKRRKCWCIKMKESLKTRGNNQPSIPSLCLSVTPSSVLEDQVLLQTGSLISVSGFVWCSLGLIQPRSPMSLSTGGGTLGKTVEPVPAVR